MYDNCITAKIYVNHRAIYYWNLSNVLGWWKITPRFLGNMKKIPDKISLEYEIKGVILYKISQKLNFNNVYF